MKISMTNTIRTIAIVAVASAVSLYVGAALAGQPQMEGALKALQTAQNDLEHVTLNKGGHAAAARKLVAEAISEVQAGIQVGHDQGM